MDLGFIGLGEMGQAIATNLLKAGHTVRVWNRSRERAEPLAALGAQIVATRPTHFAATRCSRCSPTMLPRATCSTTRCLRRRRAA